MVDNLFAPTSTNPLGQTVRINGQLFRIIGVLQSKGTYAQNSPQSEGKNRLSEHGVAGFASHTMLTQPIFAL